MGLAKLNQLYREVILDHAQNPRHHGVLTKASGTLTLRNPTCGDVINVSVLIRDNQIADVAFSETGCTISQASASLMTTVLIHQPVDQARQLILAFSHLITGQPISEQLEEQLGDAVLVGSVAEFPTRIKCAALAWHALDNLLAQKGVGNHD